MKAVGAVLAHPDRMLDLRSAARQTVIDHYGLGASIAAYLGQIDQKNDIEFTVQHQPQLHK